MGFIYKITNKINNKAYIGQTSLPVEKRWKKHITAAETLRNGRVNENSTCLNYNQPIIKALAKYGITNFIFETLEEVDNSLLDEREIYWINFYHTYGESGYNATKGGKTMYHSLSEEEKEIIITYYEETNPKPDIKVIAEMFHHSPDTISNLLADAGLYVKKIGNYGARITDERKEIVIELYKEGKYIKEIAREIHMSESNVSKILKEANIKVKSKDEILIENNKKRCSKSIVRFTKDKESATIYPSLSEASTILAQEKGDPSRAQSLRGGIMKCMKKTHYSQGYYWCYVEDLTEDNLNMLRKLGLNL